MSFREGPSVPGYSVELVCCILDSLVISVVSSVLEVLSVVVFAQIYQRTTDMIKTFVSKDNLEKTLEVYIAETKNNSSREMSFLHEPKISKDQTAYIESILHSF